ncbi:MAG: trehalase family glycosidase [Bacteroidota bacterium]|nr:trehalase family glycosidase [Bacteroidota bacterium]
MKKTSLFALGVLVAMGCSPTSQNSIFDELLSSTEYIDGTTEYLASPYVTAGDRLYMVGHQDGTFPDLGWHVTGEMGGIWDHPIKLMDGFSISLNSNGQSVCLEEAEKFRNYPFANKHFYKLNQLGLEAERTQFVPDGEEAVYVELKLKNLGGETKTVDLTFSGMIDLRPVWLGERTQMNDGQDKAQYEKAIDGIVGKDADNEWYVAFASNTPSTGNSVGMVPCDYEQKGKGVNASLTYALKVKPGKTETIAFVIAGSHQSKEKALNTLSRVREQAGDMLQNKAKRYQTIAQTAELHIPDQRLEQAFRWVKYNTDWLVRDVEGLGRGITAGIPDYPWYFGADSEYALQGAVAIGMHDVSEKTIALIDSVSNAINKGSGKIIHEMSTNGAVFNPGNLNETPQYTSLIWEVFKWTGDMDFLKKHYATAIAGLDWLLKEHDEDGNLLADGYGMMEIHGLESEMIDVAAYTYKAFIDAAQMARVLGEEERAADFSAKAEQLANTINTDFWVEEFDSYADFIGTAKEALHLIDGAIVRADTLNKPWAVLELKNTQKKIRSYAPNKKQGFVLYHNWVVNTPMEVGVAKEQYALRALKTGSKYVNPFGVFVTGIDRDESAGTDDGGFAKKMKIFSYTGAVMTLPTGVQAIAENNYGRPDEALDYLQRMTNSFSYALPGSMYEVSPDFGMIVQAWNIYSYAFPIVRQFFGINPMAHRSEVMISPLMPSTWNEAAINNLKVGEHLLSVAYKRLDNGEELTISQPDDALSMVFDEEGYEVTVVRGEQLRNNGPQIRLKGKEIVVILRPR